MTCLVKRFDVKSGWLTDGAMHVITFLALGCIFMTMPVSIECQCKVDSTQELMKNMQFISINEYIQALHVDVMCKSDCVISMPVGNLKCVDDNGTPDQQVGIPQVLTHGCNCRADNSWKHLIFHFTVKPAEKCSLTFYVNVTQLNDTRGDCLGVVGDVIEDRFNQSEPVETEDNCFKVEFVMNTGDHLTSTITTASTKVLTTSPSTYHLPTTHSNIATNSTYSIGPMFDCSSTPPSLTSTNTSIMVKLTCSTVEDTVYVRLLGMKANTTYYKPSNMQAKLTNDKQPLELEIGPLKPGFEYLLSLEGSREQSFSTVTTKKPIGTKMTKANLPTPTKNAVQPVASPDCREKAGFSQVSLALDMEEYTTGQLKPKSISMICMTQKFYDSLKELNKLGNSEWILNCCDSNKCPSCSIWTRNVKVQKCCIPSKNGDCLEFDDADYFGIMNIAFKMCESKESHEESKRLPQMKPGIQLIGIIANYSSESISSSFLEPEKVNVFELNPPTKGHNIWVTVAIVLAVLVGILTVGIAVLCVKHANRPPRPLINCPNQSVASVHTTPHQGQQNVRESTSAMPSNNESHPQNVRGSTSAMPSINGSHRRNVRGSTSATPSNNGSRPQNVRGSTSAMPSNNGSHRQNVCGSTLAMPSNNGSQPQNELPNQNRPYRRSQGNNGGSRYDYPETHHDLSRPSVPHHGPLNHSSQLTVTGLNNRREPSERILPPQRNRPHIHQRRPLPGNERNNTAADGVTASYSTGHDTIEFNVARHMHVGSHSSSVSSNQSEDNNDSEQELEETSIKKF